MRIAPMMTAVRMRRSKGSALITVTAFSLFALLTVAAIQAQLRELAAQGGVTPTGISPQMAGIGAAINLLKTGFPQTAQYSCNATLTRWFTVPTVVALQFQLQSGSLGNASTWSIQAQNGSGAGLPACPDHFN